MIILSQDGKILVKKIRNIQVMKNIVGSKKDGKYILSVNGGLAAESVLGQYAEEKNAIDELEKIYTAMAEGVKAYRVS